MTLPSEAVVGLIEIAKILISGGIKYAVMSGLTPEEVDSMFKTELDAVVTQNTPDQLGPVPS